MRHHEPVTEVRAFFWFVVLYCNRGIKKKIKLLNALSANFTAGWEKRHVDAGVSNEAQRGLGFSYLLFIDKCNQATRTENEIRETINRADVNEAVTFVKQIKTLWKATLNVSFGV